MRTAALVLEQDRLLVVASTGDIRTLSWYPQHPERVTEALSAALRDSDADAKALTLIVGLAFLEAAQPELPPVSEQVRQRMVFTDHERFFVMTGPISVAIDGSWAFGCEAASVRRWWEAFSGIAPITAVVALPTAMRVCGLQGTWSVPAVTGETGTVTVSASRISDVRRARDHSPPAVRDGALLDMASYARLRSLDAIPLEGQLLDTILRERLVGRDRARLWRAAALVAVALLLCTWALSRRQMQTIAALEGERARLEAQASGPRAAQARMISALLEQRLLDDAARMARTGTSPLRVISALGDLVPPDAFVQRLEWNGQRWRIDGSASDASRLVPLLDADSAIVDVQSLAPSTRFMDAGRARSSFSIGFGVITAAAAVPSPAPSPAGRGGAP